MSIFDGRIAILDIEVYSQYGDEFWAQEGYLVHGYDDVLWTSDLDRAFAFLKESILKAQKEAEK